MSLDEYLLQSASFQLIGHITEAELHQYQQLPFERHHCASSFLDAERWKTITLAITADLIHHCVGMRGMILQVCVLRAIFVCHKRR